MVIPSHFFSLAEDSMHYQPGFQAIIYTKIVIPSPQSLIKSNIRAKENILQSIEIKVNNNIFPFFFNSFANFCHKLDNY
jgi:hypothetical protein